MHFPVSTLRRVAVKVLAAVALFASCPGALAVTDAEMDEAKAIAAKFYVRYINNGAGYLDNWLPKSMADLEKKLSNKTDKENFRKFKSISTPSDYASWDKDRLVAYWSESFFAENGGSLDAKAADNAMCKKQIKQAVGRMAVASAAPAAAESAASTAETAAPAPAETAQIENEVDEELAQVEAELQEARDMAEREAAAPVRKESSGTWIYVMILAILVGVVIFLVVYASRTMKGQPKKEAEKDDDNEFEEETAMAAPAARALPEPAEYVIPSEKQERHSVAEDSRMREKYAKALAAKAEEIRGLNRQLNEMELHNETLKDENRRLKAEVEQLRRHVTAYQPKPIEEPRPQRTFRHEPRENDSAAPGAPREVYLGRVNSRGLFVRADRHAVDGQSIFKLTTFNGRQGTYTLIHNPVIEEQVLEDPGKWLAGGCFAKDLFDTEGKQGIFTETPGTAVFRDGAWRVEQKARIRYC